MPFVFGKIFLFRVIALGVALATCPACAQCRETEFDLFSFMDQAAAPGIDVSEQDPRLAWRFYSTADRSMPMVASEVERSGRYTWGVGAGSGPGPRIGLVAGAAPVDYSGQTPQLTSQPVDGLVLFQPAPIDDVAQAVASFEPIGSTRVSRVLVEAQAVRSTSAGFAVWVTLASGGVSASLSDALIVPASGTRIRQEILVAADLIPGDALSVRVASLGEGRFDACAVGATVFAVGSPAFIFHPRDILRAPADPIRLEARSIGPGPLGLGFRWAKQSTSPPGGEIRLNDGLLPSGAVVDGAFSDILTINNATEAEDGIYYLLVSGPCQLESFVSESAVVRTRCAVDLSADGEVDSGDLQVFITAFLAGDAGVADLTGDGQVDSGDLSVFITAFLTGC